MQQKDKASTQRPGHLFQALISQTQLSIFIQITPVLLVTGFQQADDSRTGRGKRTKRGQEQIVSRSRQQLKC